MTASFRKPWHLSSRQETLHRVRCALSRFECKLNKTHRTASTSTWDRWYSHHLTRAFSVYTDFHTSSAFHVIDHTVYPSSLRLLFLFLSICKNALLYFATSIPPRISSFQPRSLFLSPHTHQGIFLSIILGFLLCWLVSGIASPACGMAGCIRHAIHLPVLPSRLLYHIYTMCEHA